MTNEFLSCDWGTSSFRLRLVDKNTAIIKAEVVSDDGIAALNSRFKSTPGADRVDFYLSFLFDKIIELEKKADVDVKGLKVVMSGMASSVIGVYELPYGALPFSISGQDLKTKLIPYRESQVILVSGIGSDNDVMRGEETMIVGCSANSADRLCILPGTHSKHVWIENGMVTEFKTYMTGELFNLFSTKSILMNSVGTPEQHPGEQDWEHFREGVREGAVSNILNAAFHVRTAHLFGKVGPGQNYFYLSGLLIGAELRDVNQDLEIQLVSSQTIGEGYAKALQVLGHRGVTYTDAGQSLINGHLKILSLIDI